MNSSLYLLLVVVIVAFIWTYKSSMEPFQNMRPWFGYEPGYGPGWGRKECCNASVPHNMGSP